MGKLEEVKIYGLTVSLKLGDFTDIEEIKTKEAITNMIEECFDNVIFGWDLRYSPIPRFELAHQFFLLTLAMQFGMLYISAITFKNIDYLQANVPKIMDYISESHGYELLHLITWVDFAAGFIGVISGFSAEFTFKIPSYKLYSLGMLISGLAVVPLIVFDFTYTIVFVLKAGFLIICKYMISLMYYGIIYDYVLGMTDLELREELIERFKNPFKALDENNSNTNI